jgi:hypothetical protein
LKLNEQNILKLNEQIQFLTTQKNNLEQQIKEINERNISQEEQLQKIGKIILISSMNSRRSFFFSFRIIEK